MRRVAVPFLLTLLPAEATAAPAVPAGIATQLPAGYEVIASVHVPAGPGFQVVALGRKDEAARTKAGNAPPRPLVLFEWRGGRYVQVGRNDEVVLKADEGGRCDPFLDGDATIAVKGRFFTVENGVACGQHWTDYITFRLDAGGGFVFDSERIESWSMNPSDAPDAEALVRDAPQRVLRDRPGRPTAFSVWRPRR